MSNFSFIFFPFSFIAFVYTCVYIYVYISYVFYVCVCPCRKVSRVNNVGGENWRIHFARTVYAVLSRHTRFVSS